MMLLQLDYIKLVNVKRTKVDDYEDLSLSITIGGIYGNSKVNDAIKKPIN